MVFSTPAGRIIDQYDYSRANTDMSFARNPDGTGEWTTTAQPTPGYTNNNAGLEAFMRTLSYGKGEIVISEVLNANVSYLKQPDGEYYDWIEIHNTRVAPISLAGYALSNNAKNPAKWVFPDVTLDAGEYLNGSGVWKERFRRKRAKYSSGRRTSVPLRTATSFFYLRPMARCWTSCSCRKATRT
ncbi:MAG: lamin tail domain-containing protein [Eubacteriales bacterium]